MLLLVAVVLAPQKGLCGLTPARTSVRREAHRAVEDFLLRLLEPRGLPRPGYDAHDIQSTNSQIAVSGSQSGALRSVLARAVPSSAV